MSREVCYSGTEIQFHADIDEITRRLLLYMEEDPSITAGPSLIDSPSTREEYAGVLVKAMWSLWELRWNTRARTYQPAGPVANDYGT